MSKKRKGQVRPATSGEEKASPSLSSSFRSTADTFNPDYSYVKKDLRRIGALAGTFVAILLILSFFLR
jgi:hypothetical protein